jgi:hypothetical protein
MMNYSRTTRGLGILPIHAMVHLITFWVVNCKYRIEKNFLNMCLFHKNGLVVGN